MSNQSQPIYIIGGSKGGVGKSFCCIALIDTLLTQEKSVLLIESDTSNPDVYKMYKDELSVVVIDLDIADGWIELVNSCEAHPDSVVIVNTAARNNKGVAAYSETLNSTLEELKRKLITFWVINRQRDSLELLKEYMDAIPHEIHIVLNSYFGEANKFELFHESKIRKSILDRDGRILVLPELADRVSDDLYSKRLSIKEALETLPLGNKAELMRWKKLVNSSFGEILNVE